VLDGDQIDTQRSHPRPVLRRRANTGRQCSGRHVTARATPPLGTVLTDSQPHLRQVEHLARVLPSRLAVRELTPTAAAAIWHVQDDLIRLLDPLETMATMAGLTTRFAARPAPQTLGCQRLGQPVRRPWPRRITRVLHQPPLQLSDHHPQLGDQHRLLNNKRLQLPPRKPLARHKQHSRRHHYALPPRPEQSPLPGVSCFSWPVVWWMEWSWVPPVGTTWRPEGRRARAQRVGLPVTTASMLWRT
jgi:hypothetical protein